MGGELLTPPTNQTPPRRKTDIGTDGLTGLEGLLDGTLVLGGHVEGVGGEDAEDVVAHEVEVEGGVDEEHFDHARAEEGDGEGRVGEDEVLWFGEGGVSGKREREGVREGEKEGGKGVRQTLE